MGMAQWNFIYALGHAALHTCVGKAPYCFLIPVSLTHIAPRRPHYFPTVS